MKPVLVTHIERLPCATIDRFPPLGIPMTHEASGRAISARGTVKATLGLVNVPVVCAGGPGLDLHGLCPALKKARLRYVEKLDEG